MNYSPRVLAGRTFRTADFVTFLAVRIHVHQILHMLILSQRELLTLLACSICLWPGAHT